MLSLSCDQVTRLVSESQERSLTLKEKMELKVHTMMCAGCRNFENNIDIVHKAMHEFSSGEHEKRDDKDNE